MSEYEDYTGEGAIVMDDYPELPGSEEYPAYLRDVPAVADIERDFQNTARECQEIRLEDLKKEKLLTRIAGWVLKVFAPVM